MDLFRGLGKAGTDVLGGVVKGAGKVVETVGNATEKAPMVGGLGHVVEDTGKAIENVGGATQDFGEEVFEKKENKPKKGLKETILDQINNDSYGGGSKIDESIENQYDDDLMEYEAEMNRQQAARAGAEFDDDIDEAEKKLMKDQDGAVVEDSDEEEEDDAAAKIIPKNLSLKSVRNSKYLRYINEGGDNFDGLLRYSSTNIVGPYSKFAVRASKTDRGFFHIRCCYNNKYWVRMSEDSNYIAAIANEEEEDQSK